MMPNYSRPSFNPTVVEKLQKPARGTAKRAHIVRQKHADTKEDRNKTKVRMRDGHCRWPHRTPEDREVCRRSPRHVAHLTHKGAGGDPQTVRSVPEQMIAVCAPVHQGPGSLHAGDRKVLFLTPKKADGPLAFLERHRRSKWIEVARELWPGVLAHASIADGKGTR